MPRLFLSLLAGAALLALPVAAVPAPAAAESAVPASAAGETPAEEPAAPASEAADPQSQAALFRKFFGDLRRGVVRAGFEQTRYLAAFGKSFRATGAMAFSPAEGLCWTVREPVSKTWLFAGESVYELLPGGARREAGADPNGRLSRVLVALLGGGAGGAAAEVLDNFTLAEGRDGDLFLAPRDANLALALYRVRLAKEDGFLKRVTVMEKDGGYTEMLFLDPSEDAAAGGGTFCHAE